MTTLREAAQQALKILELEGWGYPSPRTAEAITALKAALEADDGMYGAKALTKAYENGWNAAKAEPEGGGNLPPPLQVPAEVAATLTTTDIAWLATCRLTKLWQELGQMRWVGADEGWDRAIEAVRSRLNDECQDVLDWKAKADQSHATAVQLLRKVLGEKDD